MLCFHSLTALRSFNVAHSKAMTSLHLNEWLPKWPHLEFLGVAHCPIDDSTLALLPRYCPRITSLCLSVTKVTHQGLAALIPLSLHTLTLAGVESLNDDALKPISEMTSLTNLNISDCFNLVGHTLPLLSKLEKLSTLLLQGSYQISDDEIVKIDSWPCAPQLTLVIDEERNLRIKNE